MFIKLNIKALYKESLTANTPSTKIISVYSSNYGSNCYWGDWYKNKFAFYVKYDSIYWKYRILRQLLTCKQLYKQLYHICG